MLEEHLGGHQGKTHTDEGTLNWAIHYLDVKSMLDIGCGPGGMVELANSMGVDAFGVDGCLLYTSPSPRDRQKSRMPSSA